MKEDIVNLDVTTLAEGLKELPEPQANPALVIVSGLPGTGKSYFCRTLASRFPLAIMESDALRKGLFSTPSYSEEENTRLFAAIHKLLEYLLSGGISLALDATNLEEENREKLYRIADKTGAKLIIVRLKASPEIIKKRLVERKNLPIRSDSSEADWSVYEKLKPTAQKIGRPHYAVDTSGDITPAIEKILKELRK